MNSLADRMRGLLLIGFDEVEASGPAAEFLAAAAGSILYCRDGADTERMRASIAGLQARAAQTGGLPLLIATDQEGGTVQRLRFLGPPWPSAMALGATGDIALTRRIYHAIGAELAEIGVNFDLAPVADLNSDARNPVIGLRSFGDEPAAVAQHVVAAVQGLHDAGVAAAVKHFPGHGDTAIDSHVALPSVARDCELLAARELVPFAAAIERGADAVMTAHVAFPAIDPSGAPATLSRAVLGDLLRGELGFRGIICTDDLEMRAIADYLNRNVELERSSSGVELERHSRNVAVQALAAGADLLLFAHSLDDARAAHEAMIKALRDGRLDEARIATSLERIDTLRAKLTRSATERARAASAAAAANPLDLNARMELARDAARRAVTLVRSAGGVPPLTLPTGARIFVANFQADAARGADGKSATTARVSSALGKALAAAGYRVTEQLRSLEPAGHEYKQLLMASGSADAIVAVTRRAFSHPLQSRAVSDLAMFGKPLAAVMALEPYDANVLPDSAALIATFGDADAPLEAAADVLTGRLQASARMPVALASSASSRA